MCQPSQSESQGGQGGKLTIADDLVACLALDMAARARQWTVPNGDEVILTLQSLHRMHLSLAEGHRDLAAQAGPPPSHTPSGDGRVCTLLAVRRSLSLVHRFPQPPSPSFRRCPTNDYFYNERMPGEIGACRGGPYWEERLKSGRMANHSLFNFGRARSEV
jgi:DNA-binding transcriptional LysR family regulator